MASGLYLEKLVERTLAKVGRHVVLGLPLGLGKPNRLVNAFYQRAKADSKLRLDIVTALSLDIPQPGHWLEARLMGPIIERQFGNNYPRLDYQVDLGNEGLPGNVTLTEFYFQSGAALGKPTLQRRYISSNYTHVARDLIDRGINVTAQLIAGPDSEGRYSLSCNPDVTLDLVRQVNARPDKKLLGIGQIHPDLPFMHGDAIVSADFYDEIIDEDPAQPLFGLPRMPVSLQDHVVGFHASRLVADGGTLQIGIGSLSDALVHSLIFRQHRPDEYRRLRDRLAAQPCSLEAEGVFDEGLYGASEMFMDGFMHLYKAGILKREVFDDLELQERANRGKTIEQSGSGALMDGGFFLGSSGFYEFLRELSEDEKPRFRMHGVGRINQLYGGSEALEIAQRRRARFINTCMMVTATGAAVSDGLADHQLVSGVGGQYNFVAMAHAMEDGRSVLMLRAARGRGDKRRSNIVWEYPHVTIPRHLRDLVVTEYGIADLRGKTDEECIKALVCISEAPFQDEMVRRARQAGKLDKGWQVPDSARANTPEALRERFQPMRERFPEYPFGSDFTEIEQRLIPALKQLQGLAESKPRLLRAVLSGRPADHQEALARLGLDQPANLKERLYARLVASVL
ncbi:MAG: acetyl-CoA hydrolase [Wenzhouxiangellaceae bacterium]|nr:MAG: acetyl-CoA hydrolase [Wenzhouxiangellaceae bacterium]